MVICTSRFYTNLQHKSSRDEETRRGETSVEHFCTIEKYRDGIIDRSHGVSTIYGKPFFKTTYQPYHPTKSIISWIKLGTKVVGRSPFLTRRGEANEARDVAEAIFLSSDSLFVGLLIVGLSQSLTTSITLCFEVFYCVLRGIVARWITELGIHEGP